MDKADLAMDALEHKERERLRTERKWLAISAVFSLGIVLSAILIYILPNAGHGLREQKELPITEVVETHRRFDAPRLKVEDSEYIKEMMYVDERLMERLPKSPRPEDLPGRRESRSKWNRTTNDLRQHLEMESDRNPPPGSLHWDLKRLLREMEEDAPLGAKKGNL